MWAFARDRAGVGVECSGGHRVGTDREGATLLFTGGVIPFVAIEAEWKGLLGDSLLGEGPSTTTLIGVALGGELFADAGVLFERMAERRGIRGSGAPAEFEAKENGRPGVGDILIWVVAEIVAIIVVCTTPNSPVDVDTSSTEVLSLNMRSRGKMVNNL